MGGAVDGIGWAKIVITGVKPDGRVEGRMEFALHSSGYSEPAPLVRAFKRWTGNIPIAFREQHR